MAEKPSPRASLPQAARVFAVLGDQVRLRICLLLKAQGEMHVTALCGVTRLPQSVVSYHLMLLRRVGVVTYHREGQYNLYSLTPGGIIHDLLRVVKP